MQRLSRSQRHYYLPGHPCRTNHGKLIPHPKNCHWYFNCTETALIPKWRHGEPFVAECRYPQLFDVNINRCREFINVECGYKFEPVDPCEYRLKRLPSTNDTAFPALSLTTNWRYINACITPLTLKYVMIYSPVCQSDVCVKCS